MKIGISLANFIKHKHIFPMFWFYSATPTIYVSKYNSKIPLNDSLELKKDGHNEAQERKIITKSFSIHPNFDIMNDRIRPLLFTISRNLLYCDFVSSKGSWHLFTISRNSLYRDSLYRSLGLLYIETISHVAWPKETKMHL